jgi:hypothetical protein
LILAQLPTFILSFTVLVPSLRSNVLFALCFFSTRILLHIILFFSYLPKQVRIATTGGSILPATILAAVFPLHAMWFRGCINGFIRRAKKNGSKAFNEVDPDEIALPDTITTLAPPPLTPDSVPTTPTPEGTVSTIITVPGSFSLPAVRLRLSVHRASIKKGWRTIRGYAE